MLDVYLGTVDRRDLEREGLVPERHVGGEFGIGWVRRLFGGGLPRHPRSSTDLGEVVG